MCIDLSSGLLIPDNTVQNNYKLENTEQYQQQQHQPMQTYHHQVSPSNQLSYNQEFSAFKPTPSAKDTGPVNISLDHKQIYKMEILDSLRHGEVEIKAQRRLSGTEENQRISESLVNHNQMIMRPKQEQFSKANHNYHEHLPRNVKLEIERRKQMQQNKNK